MNGLYENAVAALRNEIETGGARPAEIDRTVRTLLSCRDERTAGDLLLLLSDRAEYDEGMFSLIHAAESFDDSAYVQALLSAFPKLVSSSPRWASIVLMRVLNSDQARLELVRQLRGAPAPNKESMRVMCERINDVSPQFLSKTAPITLAAT